MEALFIFLCLVFIFILVLAGKKRTDEKMKRIQEQSQTKGRPTKTNNELSFYLRFLAWFNVVCSVVAALLMIVSNGDRTFMLAIGFGLILQSLMILALFYTIAAIYDEVKNISRKQQ